MVSQNSNSFSDLANLAAPSFMPPALPVPALLAPSLPPLADAPNLPLPLLPADDLPVLPAPAHHKSFSVSASCRSALHTYTEHGG